MSPAESTEPVIPTGSPQQPRLVILISGRGSNMQALVEATRSGLLPMQVAGVVADRPQAAGLQWADERGIPTRLVDHRRFAGREAFDEALLQVTAALQPDWVALAGFMRILTPAFIRPFADRLVNIHPSLLPAFPGLHTHRQALQAGVAVHGATVHRVIEALDAGEPVAQAIVPVLAGDDEAGLAARVLRMEHRLYAHALSLLLRHAAGAGAGAGAGQAGMPGGAARLLLDPSLQHSSEALQREAPHAPGACPP